MVQKFSFASPHLIPSQAHPNHLRECKQGQDQLNIVLYGSTWGAFRQRPILQLEVSCTVRDLRSGPHPQDALRQRAAAGRPMIAAPRSGSRVEATGGGRAQRESGPAGLSPRPQAGCGGSAPSGRAAADSSRYLPKGRKLKRPRRSPSLTIHCHCVRGPAGSNANTCAAAMRPSRVTSPRRAADAAAAARRAGLRATRSPWEQARGEAGSSGGSGEGQRDAGHHHSAHGGDGTARHGWEEGGLGEGGGPCHGSALMGRAASGDHAAGDGACPSASILILDAPKNATSFIIQPKSYLLYICVEHASQI
jgi:hypothetical protein